MRLEGSALAIGDPTVAPQTLNNLFTIRLLLDATATPTTPGWRPRTPLPPTIRTQPPPRLSPR